MYPISISMETQIRMMGTPASAHAAIVTSSVGPATVPIFTPQSPRIFAASGRPFVTFSGST